MRLCCIFNYAPHYRLPIYKEIDKEFEAHFYFGDRLYNGEQIKKLDFNELKGFQRELRTRFIQLGKYVFEYTAGWITLAFSSEYKRYLITPNPYSFNQWLFLFICFCLRKDVFVWMHGIRSANISRNSLLLSRLYDKFLKGSFLYGHQAKRNMISLGFREDKLHIIYNSLNYQESKRLRNLELENPYHFENPFPILLFIGRLTKIKRLDILIEAYRQLKSQGVQTNVVFIGDGPEKKNLQSMLSCEDKKYITFVGSLYQEERIAQYIYHADLCVSPGNVGLTAIHSLSYGCPVLTNNNFQSQMPEFEAIERGVSGDFFEENDIEDLVKRITEWFANNPQRNLVRERCYSVIDSKYNPFTQIEILREVISK